MRIALPHRERDLEVGPRRRRMQHRDAVLLHDRGDAPGVHRGRLVRPFPPLPTVRGQHVVDVAHRPLVGWPDPPLDVLLPARRDEGRQAHVPQGMADALRPDGIPGLARQRVGDDQQRMARLGDVRSRRRRHGRPPLGIMGVTLGGRLGQQRPGRLAVGGQLHGPARGPRRVRVARRGQVQPRLQQVALRGPRILTLGELVDHPLGSRDVAHLEQQQPDLDPRADARARRARDAMQDRGGTGSGHPQHRGRRPPARPAGPSGGRTAWPHARPRSSLAPRPGGRAATAPRGRAPHDAARPR